jgi:putative oxidoreductase
MKDAFRDDQGLIERQQVNRLFATQNERARFSSGAYVAGRVLLASLFIFGGLMFFRAPDFTFARSVIANHGLPFPAIWLVSTMVIQLGCGASILLGWREKWAAAILLIWIVPATVLFHPFWAVPAEQVHGTLFDFAKNVAVAGALLLTLGHFKKPSSSSR